MYRRDIESDKQKSADHQVAQKANAARRLADVASKKKLKKEGK